MVFYLFYGCFARTRIARTTPTMSITTMMAMTAGRKYASTVDDGAVGVAVGVVVPEKLLAIEVSATEP